MKGVLVYGFFCLVLSACGTNVFVRSTDSSVVEISRYHIRSTAKHCNKREVIIYKDTLSGERLSVEKIRTNCNGAYSTVTHHKKWELRDGKKVEILF